MITHPTVRLWAHTVATSDLFETLPELEDADLENAGEEVADIDHLHEAAGRSCYDSFDRPNPKTARNADYIMNILEQNHFSVLAHGGATFYITGISRSLSLELIRSRFLAFSQVSQRYVDSSKMDWVCPPIQLGNQQYIDRTEGLFAAAVASYEYDVGVITERLHRETDWSSRDIRKRAREAARGVLPNYTETKIVVSGNMRAWRDFLVQRLSPGADLEIRRLASFLVGPLAALAPATFADIVDSDDARTADEI